MFVGESIALIVAVSWTVTALVAEVASKRIGPLQLNVFRMGLSLLLLAATLWVVTGHPYPYHANSRVWLWLSLSGLVGYVFGDWCLFNSYVCIGSRFGQLFMTLAAPFAAIAAWALMNETMGWLSVLGMVITISGIGVSILSKPTKEEKIHSNLPVKGILFGIGAGLGQGVGLVLSKIGLEEYQGISTDISPYILPFAGTMIRASVGFLCFLSITIIQKKTNDLKLAFHDRKGMHCTFWATMTGPFIGVSLSLMAVQHANAGVAQTLMSLTPIFILWPSHRFFGTRITIREVIGAVIAVCGVTLFFI